MNKLEELKHEMSESLKNSQHQSDVLKQSLESKITELETQVSQKSEQAHDLESQLVQANLEVSNMKQIEEKLRLQAKEMQENDQIS